MTARRKWACEYERLPCCWARAGSRPFIGRRLGAEACSACFGNAPPGASLGRITASSPPLTWRPRLQPWIPATPHVVRPARPRTQPKTRTDPNGHRDREEKKLHPPLGNTASRNRRARHETTKDDNNTLPLRGASGASSATAQTPAECGRRLRNERNPACGRTRPII